MGEFQVDRAPRAESAIVCHTEPDGTTSLLLSGQVVSGPAGAARLIPIEKSWSLVNTIGGNGQSAIDDRVTSLDFSTDGRLIAVGSGTASRRGNVSILDVATGDVLWESERLHSDTVLSVRFSPGGRFLASGAADKTIRIIDVATGETIRALDGHTHHVLSIAWSHDGQTLVSGSADESTGVARRTIRGLGGEVTSMQLTERAARAVSTSTSGHVRVHDIANGRQIHASDARGDILFAGRLDTSGNRFFAVGQSGDLHVWKADTMEKQ